jgi:hypothetical protein
VISLLGLTGFPDWPRREPKKVNVKGLRAGCASPNRSASGWACWGLSQTGYFP